jgi:hypothetical protein
MKTIAIGDILPPDAQRHALRIVKRSHGHLRHGAIVELIRPRMADINKATGQENDVDYLAYAVEYLLTRDGPP